MKVTKRQLRRIIKESCGLDTAHREVTGIDDVFPAAPTSLEPASDEVPAPADYNAVRDMLEQNPEVVDLGISAVMNQAGTGCERSTAQGIIDHLQDVVSSMPAEQAGEPLTKKALPPLPSSSMEMIKGPGF